MLIFCAWPSGVTAQRSTRLTMNPFSGEWRALTGSAGGTSMRNAVSLGRVVERENSNTELIGIVPVFSASPS